MSRSPLCLALPRLFLAAALGAVFTFLAPAPKQAEAQEVILASTWRVSCGQGQRIMRNRGYWDVRIRSCGGRLHVYRAWRGNSRWEVWMRSSDGRIVDRRRIARR
jgi:hypothetical protein